MTTTVLYALLALAALIYLGGIIWQAILIFRDRGNRRRAAALASTTSDEKIPTALRNAITSINALLAANFGAIVGLSVGRGATFGESFRAAVLHGAIVNGGNPEPTPTQQAAVWLFLLGLIIATASWVKLKLADDAPELVKTMGMTFLGLVVGAVAVALKAAS